MEQKGEKTLMGVLDKIVNTGKLKVSIIVPVYNAGIHLKPCLDSLVGQTLKEIEIVLVLDVPTDGSDKVAEEYAQRDKRIKLVYNKLNLHIGFSRNEGLKVAQGEYIGFADHDDYCEIDMFEQLYRKAKNNDADVVVSNFYVESETEKFFFGFPDNLPDAEFQDNVFKSLINARISRKNTYSFDNVNVIWNQLFRREFLKLNDIWFTDNKVITMEDVLFNIKVHFSARKVCYLPETYYHHVNNSQNEFDSYDYRAIAKVIPHLLEIDTFLRTNNIWQQYGELFAECTLKRLYTSYRNEVKFKKFFYSVGFFKRVRNNNQLQNILKVFQYNDALIKKFPVTKICFLFLIRK